MVSAPDEVAAYCQALVDAGTTSFVVQTQIAADSETIELLAREVIPKVQPRP